MTFTPAGSMVVVRIVASGGTGDGRSHAHAVTNPRPAAASEMPAATRRGRRDRCESRVAAVGAADRRNRWSPMSRSRLSGSRWRHALMSGSASEGTRGHSGSNVRTAASVS